MNQKLLAETADFDQPRRSRNYFWVTPAVLLALYYIYVLYNGWGVEVVELRPTRCQLVNHFDSAYFKYRDEGILELKSKAASLGADTLYVPYPRDTPYAQPAGADRQVHVPAWAYRCDS